MLALVLVFTLGLGVYFTWQHIRDFEAGLADLERETLARQQSLLAAELDSSSNYLEFVRSRTEAVLKEALKAEVDQAYQVVEAIYRQEKGRRPEAEIRRLASEALRPMRFFDGRGYFFIDDRAGNCVLLPISPEREGSSLLDNRDDTGHYIMRGLIEAAKDGQGYSRYRWYAPGNSREMADKIAYVRNFEPFGWIIGAGDYLSNMEQQLSQEALVRLRSVRFGKDGYLAVLHRDGRVLVSPSRPNSEGVEVAHLPSEAERRVVRQLLDLARQGGGVARYDWLHPERNQMSSKFSMVRAVDSWGWVLVAGVYLDDLDTVLKNGQSELAAGVRSHIVTTVLVLALAAAATFAFSLLFSRWLGRILHAYRDDIETRNAQLIENAQQLRLAAQVFESGNEGIVITDPSNRILTVNRAFSAITGYAADEVVGQNPSLFSSGRHSAEFYAAMWRELNERGTWAGEIWNRRKDGTPFPEWLNISAVKNDRGEVTHYIAAFSDITERKAAEAQVRHMAEYDALTNLPNRVLLQDRLGQAIAAAQRGGGRMALIFIDLDRFKNINDSLGHAIGDQVLCQVGARLADTVRASDTVSRLGGDEFVVLLPELDAPNQAASVAEKLLVALSQPLQADGHELAVTPSIGIAVFPEDGQDGSTLLKNADAAMYYAKDNGRNNFQFFTPEMNARVSERLALENNLRQAIARNELFLHYQPQFDLQTGELTGCEALVRWQHPELGLIPPSRFIPVAEDSGLILPLGHWVLREACRQAKAWQDAGLRPIPVAVNLSAVQFRQARLATMIADVLAESGLAPRWLELELTESMLMEDGERHTTALADLKALGVGLALDDFGTGYSSLSYLKRFDLDTLKIDRSFVQSLPDDSEDAALTTAIIGIARQFGLKTVAEGVETEAQRAFLAAQGCTLMQGFLLARPMAGAELAELLETVPA
ncbi:diguanylate cyclase/phosphodiesterase with PAS/PAC sensor [Oryzomicrobium terrae]|uniref:Diguanylate cyclase/phosphodiesterase with PAS/PAC sensor n=1 Tax=Oryzomicrobium terrae TaxID=1735038 RepID=A0A5C1E6B6_9RHOO|nr:EAL domain-containing protein [Oryzomicrobium terrae]QEL64215.1 diguanylate cyclase/phosphodiesterase with PAS/PAC sensor [Oryzomicrobium terrae]